MAMNETSSLSLLSLHSFHVLTRITDRHMPSAVHIHINADPPNRSSTHAEPASPTSSSSVHAERASSSASLSQPTPLQFIPKHGMVDYLTPCLCPLCTGELDKEDGEIVSFAPPYADLVRDESSLTVLDL